MKKNEYVKWKPIENIPVRLSCEGLHDDYEGFRILLKGQSLDSLTLRIVFDPTLAYRNIDESDLLKTINDIKDLSEHSLFIVKNSTWLKWFNEQSFGNHDDEKVVHYAIFTENDCIDVLSLYEPIIDWL